MRLIDADKLVDMLYDSEYTTLCPLDEVCGVIDACPTAEFAPVQNGELRDAAAQVTKLAAEAAVERDWISVTDRLPEDDGDVLAIVSGYPTPNITLEDVLVVAAFCEGEGWYIEEYPDWDNPIITYWMPLPEPPREEK